YYLRTMAATHVEKSTVAHGALNAVPTRGGSGSGGAQGAAGGFGAAGGAASSSGAGDAAPALAPVEADGPVCTMRPGDPGF
ncbi:hypothetical protein NO135_23225, partial [Clostridioides difficile]|nr:hypothetical protein [Clostridioides difficile]